MHGSLQLQGPECFRLQLILVSCMVYVLDGITAVSKDTDFGIKARRCQTSLTPSTSGSLKSVLPYALVSYWDGLMSKSVPFETEANIYAMFLAYAFKLILNKLAGRQDVWWPTLRVAHFKIRSIIVMSLWRRNQRQRESFNLRSIGYPFYVNVLWY